LRADSGYWVAMLTAGTLGTVLGDYFSHDLHLAMSGHRLRSVLCWRRFSSPEYGSSYGRCRSIGRQLL
jgi:hypothetical protein